MKFLNKIKKSTIILLIVTIIVLYFILRNDLNGIIKLLKSANIWYLIIAIVFYLAYCLIRAYVNYMIINDKKRVNLKEAISQNFITQFFNGITPFSTGGQPMEIYMLKKSGISLANATNITVQSFIFYQIALIVCGIIAIVYNLIFHIFLKGKILQYLVAIGFSINIIVIVLLLLSYSKLITNYIVKIITKIFKKFKIDVSEEQMIQKINEYHDGFHKLRTNKKIIIIGLSLNIISLFIFYSIPFFIFLSLGKSNIISIIETIVTSAYVYIIGAFIPIPGASGGIEYGFTQFFGNFAEIKVVAACVIIWRAITYYLGMIIGAIAFNMHKKEIKQ